VRLCSLRLRLAIIVISVSLFPTYSQDTVQVQELKELDIRYAAELNHVPIGCRTIAMGNTGVTLPYNDMSIYWNPSAISFSDNYDISIEGAKLYGGLSSLGGSIITVLMVIRPRVYFITISTV